jgi:putative membrane protein
MKWLWIVVVLILIVVGITSFGVTQPNFCGTWGWGHYGHYGIRNLWYGGIIMWLIFLIIIGVIIYFIINRDKLVKREGDETPLEILKKRYAKGEITKEEFEKLKKDIQ